MPTRRALSRSSSTIVGQSTEKWSLTTLDTKRASVRAAMASSYARRMSAIDSGPAKPITRAPMPSSAAWASVSVLLHARKSGGCGVWCGRGRIGCGSMSRSAPWCSSSSFSQALPMIWSASSTSWVVRSLSTPHSDVSCVVPPRPAPRSRRPPESRSSIAARSATRAGWLKRNGMQTTPCPIRMVLVRAATQVRKISGALMCAYHLREWCSTAQTRSNPIRSANTACSTLSRITWCSRSTVGSASCASKMTENFTCPPGGVPLRHGPCFDSPYD